MKKHFYILAIILLSLISFQSTASHLVGSDITYHCTSTPGVYKITMKIYRDCAGIPLCPGCSNTIPTGTVSGCTTASSGWGTQILGVTTGCTGVNYGAFTLNAISATSGYDIIRTCSSVQTICTNCNTRNAGTYSPAIEVYTYEGNVDLSSLPTSCCRVLLGANTCCRNGALTSIVPGSYQSVCEIDRCQSTCNSAPIFTNDAFALVCGNVDFVYNLGAIDPDGDSLSYAFGQSLQGVGTPVSYVPPYSAAYPFPYFGAPNPNAALPAGLHIDPATGDVMFRPIGIFVANFVIEVTQWKLVGGARVNVGMTRRDIQFQTALCTNNKIPIIKVYKNNLLQSGSSYTTNAGTQFCLDMVTEDQGQVSPYIASDTTDMNWNNPGLYVTAMANATFTRNYILSTRGINGPKADSFKFCWTPPIGSNRQEPYMISVTGYDRFCPIMTFATRGINIKVLPNKSVNIDSISKNTFCKNSNLVSNVYYSARSINLVTSNVFSVQLSDSSGSFASATTIGTKTSIDTIGLIYVTIPSNLFANSNYKIRVVCTSDTIKSEPKNITIFDKPSIGTITGNAAPNSISTPFAYSVLSQANSTYSWSATNGTIQSGQGTNAVNIVWPSTGTGNLMAKITNNNSCTDSTNLLVNITSVGVKEINTNPFSQINFKPNPFTNELEISFTSKTKELTKLVIIDAVGKEVFVKNIPSNIGNNTFIIDEMAHLKPGVYFARLANNNGMSNSIKLVKE